MLEGVHDEGVGGGARGGCWRGCARHGKGIDEVVKDGLTVVHQGGYGKTGVTGCTRAGRARRVQGGCTSAGRARKV